MERKEFQRKVSLGDIVLINYKDSKDRSGFAIGRYSFEYNDQTGISLSEDMHTYPGWTYWEISARNYYKIHLIYPEIIGVRRLIEAKKFKKLLRDDFGKIPDFIKFRNNGLKKF